MNPSLKVGMMSKHRRRNQLDKLKHLKMNLIGHNLKNRLKSMMNSIGKNHHKKQNKKLSIGLNLQTMNSHGKKPKNLKISLSKLLMMISAGQNPKNNQNKFLLVNLIGKSQQSQQINLSKFKTMILNSKNQINR